MILGVLERGERGIHLKEDLLRAADRVVPGGRGVQPAVWANRQLAFCSTPGRIGTLDDAPQPFVNEDQTIAVTCQGKIYNSREIKRSLGSGQRFRTGSASEILGRLYEKFQEDFLDQVNGAFAFVLWDEGRRTLLLGRDRLGIEPLYYADDGTRFVFASSARALVATGWIECELDHGALLQYLLYCYNPTDTTLLRRICKLPAGHLLAVGETDVSMNRYWHLSFAETQPKTEEEYGEEILSLIEDAIRIRLDKDCVPGVLLSGGTDSSAIVSLTSRLSSGPISTFSFRCEERSYDESPHARFVAQHYGTRHTEIPYRPDHLSLIGRVVESMDEPFCDLGIEIGTYLLGQAASGSVSYVFSGEGGDELFGGHPVYLADRIAAVVDRVPQGLIRPLARMLQRIPDSDQKKNLQVKLKRFAYSLSFPPELLSHRWRVYYRPEELQELCNGDFIAQCNLQGVFDGMLKYTREADGNDPLSRSLYSDFQTLVGFYLRRLALLREFSVESRVPLLDHRLVEYAARIPSRLKVQGLSSTKYLYRRVLERILPREILYNRPKLGHSVPMKNWLREDASLRGWMTDMICDGWLAASGFLRPDVIRRMVEEHVRRVHNHSHRLWGLVVLEAWVKSLSGSPRVAVGSAG